MLHGKVGNRWGNSGNSDRFYLLGLQNHCRWWLQKTLESPLDCKEIKPVHPKGNQPWIFIGKTDAEAEAPVLWPPDAKNWLLGKDPDAGKDWRQEKKATTEDEMVGWHHQVNGHEFEQALGGGDGQGSLACCSPWCCKELDMIEWMNWNDRAKLYVLFGSHTVRKFSLTQKLRFSPLEQSPLFIVICLRAVQNMFKEM